jgi:hypothetical protein
VIGDRVVTERRKRRKKEKKRKEKKPPPRENPRNDKDLFFNLVTCLPYLII